MIFADFTSIDRHIARTLKATIILTKLAEKVNPFDASSTDYHNA
jgi:hypothetical protein